MELSVKFAPPVRGHPSTLSVTIREPSQPERVVVLWFFLTIDTTTTEPGEFACTGLEILPAGYEALEITPATIAHVERNWDRYLELARQAIGWDVDRAAVKLGPLRRRGRQGMSEEFYRGIAEQYRTLVERGERPTASIAKAHDVGRSTASRWIREARDRGLLGPAIPRRAGERTEAKR